MGKEVDGLDRDSKLLPAGVVRFERLLTVTVVLPCPRTNDIVVSWNKAFWQQCH